MKLSNEFAPIRAWARAKGILDRGDAKTQTLKLQEEAGELAKAVIHQDHKEIKDAIGDCVVVLTSLAHLCGTSIEDCVNEAYKVIENRRGQMINGTFKKEE